MNTGDTTLSSDADTLWVLHVTDNHLFQDATGGRRGVNSSKSLRAVLCTALEEHQPDIVVNTGDVANDSTEEVYREFLRCLREFTSCDYIATPGNHDLSNPFFDVLKSERIDAKGWRIVAVDTHEDDVLSGYVSAQGMNQLVEEISQSLQPTLVVGHHPATPIGCDWIDAHRIRNGQELLDALAQFEQVKAYLCGHVHQAFDGEYQGIALMTTPSTCWQFKPQTTEFAFDDVPAGWRWLQLKSDGTIDSKVCRLLEAV